MSLWQRILKATEDGTSRAVSRGMAEGLAGSLSSDSLVRELIVRARAAGVSLHGCAVLLRALWGALEGRDPAGGVIDV